MLKEEVTHGWQLVLPPEAALEIPDAVLAPLGMANQNTINERGEIVPKSRLTHDQSFTFSSGQSVNKRLFTNDITPCMFGHAIRRHTHTIVGFRLRHPTERTFQTKADCKSACRRLHNSATSAARCLVAIGGLLLMALCLTFGGAANPSLWGDCSEILTDFSNNLVWCDEWTPVELQ